MGDLARHLATGAAVTVLVLSQAVAGFAQNTMQFPDARETVPELIDLWQASNSVCRGAAGGDVKVAAACLSRSVYGAALNERNWCFGQEDQSGAQMNWHECTPDSLRFAPFAVPDF